MKYDYERLLLQTLPSTSERRFFQTPRTDLHEEAEIPASGRGLQFSRDGSGLTRSQEGGGVRWVGNDPQTTCQMSDNFQLSRSGRAPVNAVVLFSPVKLQLPDVSTILQIRRFQGLCPSWVHMSGFRRAHLWVSTARPQNSTCDSSDFRCR